MDKVLVARAVFPEVVEALRAHFEVEANPDDRVYTKAELIERLQGKAGAFTTGSERIDAEVLAACPALRAVCNMAVGYNNIDVPACSARGIVVTNTPDVLTETTADFGFALMMAAARRIAESEHYLRRGEWTKWHYDQFMSPDVHGTTLGILGMGRIGRAIARRGALGFGMPVIYHNRSRLPAEQEAESGARWVDKATLLREADHLILVVPYSPASHHAIGAAELALMKPTATLTNIARGGIVDDAALAMCGVSTTLGTVSRSGCTLGSPSNTSRPAAAMRFSRRACASAASSTMPPRAMLTSVAVGFICASSDAPIVWCEAAL